MLQAQELSKYLNRTPPAKEGRKYPPIFDALMAKHTVFFTLSLLVPGEVAQWLLYSFDREQDMRVLNS